MDAHSFRPLYGTIGLSLYGLGAIPTGTTRSELRRAPLGPVSDTTVSVSKILSVCEDETVCTILRGLTGTLDDFGDTFICPSFKKSKDKAEFLSTIKTLPVRPSKPSECIKGLEKAGVLQQYKVTNLLWLAAVCFPVLKSDGVHVRGVIDPLLNNILPKPLLYDCGLPRIHMALEAMAAYSYAVVYDAVSCFYQFPLSDAVASLFTVKVANKYYRHTRLPMGFCYAVHCTQLFLMWLASTAATRAGLQEGQVMSFVWVDNVVLLATSRQALQSFEQSFTELLKELTVNCRKEQDITPLFTWAGLEIDLTAKSYGLSTKWVSKVKPWQAGIQRAAATSSLVPYYSWQKWIGIVVYACYIRRFSFGLLRPYFQTMKSPQRLVDISAIHHGFLDNLLNREMLPLIPPQRTEAPFQIWTDASTEAAGGILIHDDEQLSPEDFTYIWPTHLQNLHINVKEALALLLALHLWQPKDTHVTVWVDNTAVIGAVTKGYSPSEQLNTVVKSIINLCEYLNLSITCLYVPSAMNIADSLSRPSEWFST